MTVARKTLFICDAHLGTKPDDSPKEEVLIEFIKNMSPDRVEALYVLGDLFDFWFEYKTVVLSRYFKVLTELARAVERGIEIHLIVGNHDFWAGDFLRNVIGLSVHYDPIEINLDGMQVYLCHGDGLNPFDRGYHVIKAIVRSRPVIWFARILHPDWVAWIARRFSRFSRNTASVAGNLREDDGIRRFALKKLRDGVDVVIAGHSHQPHDEKLTIDGTIKRYFNAGDMQERFSYLEYYRGEFRLKFLEQSEKPS